MKDGRKRLADVIQELQTSTSFDRDSLQSRLQEVNLNNISASVRPRYAKHQSVIFLAL